MFVSLLKAVTVAITGGKNINNVSVMGVRTISLGGWWGAGGYTHVPLTLNKKKHTLTIKIGKCLDSL